ncbi:MAG: hypothetical protein ACYC91_20730 [Solirubrobacteraceae bacterium]
MDVEQPSHEVSDQPRGVIGMVDHLHDVTDRSLEQLNELSGRRIVRHLLQFGDHRLSGSGPCHRFAVVEEAPSAQPSIDLGAKL